MVLIGQSATPDPWASPEGDALLCATGIKKVFGGAVALSHGNLSVRAGEIHALLGENGAGKSTLIKCLAGTPPPDTGEILIDGRALPLGHSARHAAEAGLAFIHQETALIESSVGRGKHRAGQRLSAPRRDDRLGRGTTVCSYCPGQDGRRPRSQPAGG